MQITITATDQLTTIDGVPVRVWTGLTERGIPCTVLVHRLAVHHLQDSSQFDTELQETLPPGHAVPLREVLP